MKERRRTQSSRIELLKKNIRMQEKIMEKSVKGRSRTCKQIQRECPMERVK